MAAERTSKDHAGYHNSRTDRFPFVYSIGDHAIDIAWVALLEDGQEISRAEPIGFSGGTNSTGRIGLRSIGEI